jgi:hypothetical protein
MTPDMETAAGDRNLYRILRRWLWPICYTVATASPLWAMLAWGSDRRAL